MNLLKISLGLLFFVLFQGFSLYRPFLQIPKNRLFQNLALGLFNLAVITLFFTLWPFATGISDGRGTHFAVRAVLMVFIFDALSYFWHRSNHQFPPLWRWHQLHHKEATIDTSTAYRFHPIEIMMSLVPKIFLLWILQASWQELTLFEIIFTASNLFQHSNFRLPKKVDRLILHFLVTPSLHRRHHSIEVKNQNTNFGTIFSFWDRLFKTYSENIDEQITKMGLTTNPQPDGY